MHSSAVQRIRAQVCLAEKRTLHATACAHDRLGQALDARLLGASSMMPSLSARPNSFQKVAYFSDSALVSSSSSPDQAHKHHTTVHVPTHHRSSTTAAPCHATASGFVVGHGQVGIVRQCAWSPSFTTIIPEKSSARVQLIHTWVSFRVDIKN